MKYKSDEYLHIVHTLITTHMYTSSQRVYFVAASLDWFFYQIFLQLKLPGDL